MLARVIALNRLILIVASIFIGTPSLTFSGSRCQWSREGSGTDSSRTAMGENAGRRLGSQRSRPFRTSMVLRDAIPPINVSQQTSQLYDTFSGRRFEERFRGIFHLQRSSRRQAARKAWRGI